MYFFAGTAPEEMGFFIEERKMMILGSILPRADRPARWDLPEEFSRFDFEYEEAESHEFGKNSSNDGTSHRRKKRISEVLKQHLDFFEECFENDGTVKKSCPNQQELQYGSLLQTLGILRKKKPDYIIALIFGLSRAITRCEYFGLKCSDFLFESISSPLQSKVFLVQPC